MDDDGPVTMHIAAPPATTIKIRVFRRCLTDLADSIGDPWSHNRFVPRSPFRFASPGQRVCALMISSARDRAIWDDQIVGRVQLLAEILDLCRPSAASGAHASTERGGADASYRRN